MATNNTLTSGVLVNEELVGYITMALRILLPVLVLALGLPKASWSWNSGPKYSRSTILANRVPKEEGPVPAELRSLLLVTEDAAPTLFQYPPLPPVSSRSHKDRTERAAPKQSRRRPPEAVPEPILSAPTVEASPLVPPAGPAKQVLTIQGRMNVEGLLNFVAFHPREQQRVFLPEGPPPPPPKPAKALEKAGPTAVTANEEAQIVLRGVIQLKACTGSSVAKQLRQKLTALGIDLSRETFELMITACIKAGDLPAASELLVKMEAAGFAPGNNMLDEVMELYLERRKSQEASKASEALAATMPHEMPRDFASSSTSSHPPAHHYTMPAGPHFAPEGLHRRSLPSRTRAQDTEPAFHVPEEFSTLPQPQPHAAHSEETSPTTRDLARPDAMEGTPLSRLQLSADAAEFVPGGKVGHPVPDAPGGAGLSGMPEEMQWEAFGGQESSFTHENHTGWGTIQETSWSTSTVPYADHAGCYSRYDSSDGMGHGHYGAQYEHYATMEDACPAPDGAGPWAS